MSSNWLARQGLIFATMVLLSGCVRGTETRQPEAVGIDGFEHEWPMSVARKAYVELQQELTCATQLFVKKLNWATDMNNETLISGREKSLINQSMKLIKARDSIALRLRDWTWPTSLRSNIAAEIAEMKVDTDLLARFQNSRDRQELMRMVSDYLFRDSPVWNTLAETREHLKISDDEAFSCPSMPGLIDSNMKAREQLGEFPMTDEGEQKALEALRAAGGDMYQK